MARDRNDIIVEMLKFMQQRNFDGSPVSFQETLDHLSKRNHFPPGNDHTMKKRWIEHLFYNEIGWDITGDPGGPPKRMLKLDSYLGLLDYEELQQARNDAAEAKRTARTAILLNILALLLATVIGIAQIAVAWGQSASAI